MTCCRVRGCLVCSGCGGEGLILERCVSFSVLYYLFVLLLQSVWWRVLSCDVGIVRSSAFLIPRAIILIDVCACVAFWPFDFVYYYEWFDGVVCMPLLHDVSRQSALREFGDLCLFFFFCGLCGLLFGVDLKRFTQCLLHIRDDAYAHRQHASPDNVGTYTQTQVLNDGAPFPASFLLCDANLSTAYAQEATQSTCM